MDNASDLPASVIDSFHLMWGNFPECVTLVHKSRTVMAINKAGKDLGILSPGLDCSKIGSPTSHKACLANKALASGQSAYCEIPMPDSSALAFWLPLDGYPDFYVHFGVGTSLNYKTGQRRDGSAIDSPENI